MQTDTLAQAIALARAGQSNQARGMLLEILKTDPSNETAWMWLVQVLPNNAQRLAAIEQWLKQNPRSVKARQGLERLSPGASAPGPGPSPERSAGAPTPSLGTAAPDPVQPRPKPDPAWGQAKTDPAQPAPAESRPRAPMVLGKAVEDEPEPQKSGWMDLFRPKTGTRGQEEPEADLGISIGAGDQDQAAAVARVFSSPIDDTDFEPKIEPELSAVPAEQKPGQEDGDSSILEQLRGKGAKKSASRRPTSARSVIRVVLLAIYLVAFGVAGYFGWQRYGADVTRLLEAGLSPQPTLSPEERVAADAEEEETDLEEPTVTGDPAVSTAAVPTETPVPVIGERPAAGLGAIVYSAASPEGDLDIFTLPPEGGEAQDLTQESSGDDRDPALSKDGILVYSLNGSDLYQVNTAGKITRLTRDGAGNREPAWSPDGTKIAYVSERDGNAEIYLMDADGQNPVRITNHPAHDGSPAWAPDGARLAFVSDRDGTFEIYTLNADGSGVYRLTYDLVENKDPDWSPDGRWIVFSSDRDSDREIYTITPEGSQRNRITFSPGADEQPVWSPDGLWILFTSARDPSGVPGLYLMVMDGSRPFSYFSPPNPLNIAPPRSTMTRPAE